MRRLLIASLLLLRTCSPAFAEDIGGNTICFVPGPDDCAMVAVKEIDKAQRTVDFESYNFTEPHIAQALLDAHNRGVSVRLISDKTGPREKNGEVLPSAQAGIPVWIDNKPRIAHNKVIIIDGQTTIGGSYNYSTNANLHNAENLTIIRDPLWAAAYEANFESRLAASMTLEDYQAAHEK
jgi:phosphatidylserine/phosphatidylglycerophosphate/cardiolipin synthase-like enzyme